MKTDENIFSLFAPFVKQKDERIATNKNAIIYTRVSSKEQVENNSLEIQHRECLAYAAKRDLLVVREFGGTYESAQTDERKEFMQMMAFAKRQRVSTIIVYSLDRFSRSGDNAIWLLKQLKEKGVSLLSVTQPVDTSSSSGSFVQKMMLLVAELDNDQRRLKTVGGMQERLRKGLWCGVAPFGYKNATINGEKTILVNETYSHLIKKAFEWKANYNLTDVEIADRLNAAGYPNKHRTVKHLNIIFRNPFYCGLIVHSVIPGEMIEGKHKPLISRELFLKVNNIKDKNVHGYKVNTENEAVPLRSFVRCEYCGTGYAGYLVRKKGLYYYKCNQRGCKCNRSAKLMHEQFNSVLSGFSFDERLKEPLKAAMLLKIDELTKANREMAAAFQKQKTEAEKKLDAISERFALGEIKADMFDRFAPKYKQEIAEIDQQLYNVSIDLSNREKYADMYLEKALNASEIWGYSDYQTKVRLQRFIFPDGIRYDHKLGVYRTSRINGVFAFIASYTGTLQKEKTGLFIDNNEKSGLVARRGIDDKFPVCPVIQPV